jgi:hypothetical protein
MPEIVRYRRDGVVSREPLPPINPDDTPDEDPAILRRVVINLMRNQLGLTNPQVRAAFAAAKRQID